MDQIAADYHCSRDRTWIDGPERFDHKDCLGPIYKMQFEESAEDWKAEVPKEFVTRSGPRSGDLGLTLVTPRKYVVDVRPADLPGDSGHSALVSDVSSFQRIAEKAYEVFTFCGKRQRLPGWALIGRDQGKVFFKLMKPPLALDFDPSFMQACPNAPHNNIDQHLLRLTCLQFITFLSVQAASPPREAICLANLVD
ncbi:hypothetical protein Q9189_006583 [Teloschistes chrysophthalmus]